MKKETLKCRCKKCGEIEVDFSYPFSNGDGEGFIIPTAICPTIQSLGKFYKKIEGSDYLESTGNKIKDDFKKELATLCHLNPEEDVNYEEHSLEPIECWFQQI